MNLVYSPISERPLMSAKVIQKCLIFLADEDQFSDYIDFKSSLEEIPRGIVDIEDFESIKKAGGVANDQKLERFIKERDVLILICSDKMKSLIDYGKVDTLDFNGSSFILNGQVLRKSLENANIGRKVILVSFDGSEAIPAVLNNNDMTTVFNDEVTDAFANEVIFQIRGMRI